MVYESPAAAGRPMVCRKHSPWTMERDRKKSKAHLGSPEPLSEEVEEEEAEPDDHDMTEQEAEVLAGLGQLNVDSSVANQGDTDSAALSRAVSAPDGQRRKLRGSRALSASYHNRLQSCLLNEKGSPLPHCARSYTTFTGVSQENAAAVLFPPVLFGEHSKCWFGRRHSPSTKEASGTHLQQHQGTTGVTLSTTFPAHGPVLHTAADQSLLAAAALANSSRHDKHLSCGSPAPKGRSHRRSLSGASVAAAGGLNDSAETLHGPSAESCAGGQGQPLQSGGRPHPRGVSEGSAHRHVAALKTNGAANADQGSIQSQGCVDNERDCTPNGLHRHSRPVPSSASTSTAPVAPLVSVVSDVAKFGIAAFGVPACVQSCFEEQMAASMQQPAGDAAAPAGQAVPSRELPRCAMSCPGDMGIATAVVGALGRHMGHHAGFEGFASGPSAAAGTNANHVVDAISEFGMEPLMDVSSEPRIFGHARHGTPSGGTGLGKALADSAEELELRRLALQQRQVIIHDQKQSAELQLQHGHQQQQQSSCSGTAHSRPTSTGSPGAGPTTLAGADAAEALSDPSAMPTLAPFDLVSLARSAGAVCFGTTDFGSFITSGPLSIDALAAVGSTRPSSLWASSQGGSTHNISSSFASSDPDNTCNNPEVVCGKFAWLGSSLISNTVCPSPEAQTRPPGVPVGISLGAIARMGGSGSPGHLGLELNCAVGGNGDGDVRCDQDVGHGCGDIEDGQSWLRTSHQAPDPDDPSSAGKYSAVLLRRLQAAAEHEELYGAASGDHSGACGFYHLQGSCGSGLSNGDYGLRGSTGRLHLGSHGSSSMEPSPLPRLSSRMRRLRVSPCLGGAGSSIGPLTSPTPSLLLGTRSRSAGVTPGAITCRRLRRRSDLVVTDQLGQISARGYADVDELEYSDSGAGTGADEHMHDAGHQLFAAGGSGGRLRLLAGRSSDKGVHAHRKWVAAQQRHVDGSGLRRSATPGLRSEPMQRTFSQAGGDPVMIAREHSAGDQPMLSQNRVQPHTGEDFLSGLMDYEDEGVEYTTPPHTPLRGVDEAHENDASTAARAAMVSKPLGASAIGEVFFAIAPGRGRPGLGLSKGLLQQRVTFAHRLGGTDSHPNSPPAATGGDYPGHGKEGSSCAQLLMSQSLENTQEFNRCLAVAATRNDRGSAERLWQEMCSRGVTPDAGTLNLLLRCLSRSAADPDEAQLLAREVCSRGGFSVNASAQRLLEEICFRFEQLNGNSLAN